MTTGPILFGIVFVFIGLCTLKFRKQKKSAGLIPLIIGLTVILITTVGPLSKSQEQVNKVLNLDKDQIVKVIIKPTKYRGYEQISLTQNIIEVTDKNAIDSLCYSLRKAKKAYSSTNSPDWVCLVRFEKMDQSFIEVDVKGAGAFTFVEVKSDGDYGWNYGALEAKSFGQVLLSLTR